MKTYSELFSDWNENIKPLVIETYGADDIPALSESWNDYTDSECKDGSVTDLQYNYCPAFDDSMPDDEDDTLNHILESMGVRVSTSHVIERPDGLMSDMPDGSTHWEVTITRGAKSMSLYYSMGPAHTGLPDELDIIGCVLMDMTYTDETFEDFCNELGYDDGSRTAERIYNATVKQTRAMRELFTPSELDDLQELFSER